MKPIHILLTICCMSLQANAQLKLSLQAGGGYSFITVKKGTLSNQLTTTGGLSFTGGNFREFDYGLNVYFERYALTFSNTQSSPSSIWGSDVKANASYLLIAPQLEFRIMKYVHLNLLPSVGFLLSGKEQVYEHADYINYGLFPVYPSTDSSYTTSSRLHPVIFRMAAELQEFIPVSKDWWVTVSQRATYCLPKSGITESKVVRNHREQNANPLYCSLQLGIAHRFARKQSVSAKE